MNKRLLYIGLGLFFGSIVLNGVFDASNSQYAPDPLDGLWGPLALLGIILVIVGAARGGGAPQQQQQSVVVYAGAPGDPAPGAPRAILKCPTCGTLNEANARFCQECGKAIPQPRGARPSMKPAAGSRGKKK